MQALTAVQGYALGLIREVVWFSAGVVTGTVPFIVFGIVADYLEPPRSSDTSHLAFLWFSFWTVPIGCIVSASTAARCQAQGFTASRRVRTCLFVNAALAGIISIPLGCILGSMAWRYVKRVRGRRDRRD